jgi:formylglycine-generating enzyme required for sulfatase activity/rhodanese-related sulfurtransferase/predicted  nucleic acid-binding Zn-ribbon protein
MLTKGVMLRLAKEDFIEFVKRPLAKGVSFKEADQLINDGEIWLDVRTPSAYEKGHLEHSVSFPLETLRYQAPNLAADQKYVICCEDGYLSSTAAYLLTDRGFSVSVLEGGLRNVPSDMLIKEEEETASPGAKVISLHPGEEIEVDQESAAETTGLYDLREQLDASNNRIKELGVKFQKYREKQQKDDAKLQAEIKAQKVIIDKNRVRLDELRIKRETDRRLIEQLQQEAGELNASLNEATEKLAQAKDNVIDLEAKLNVEYDLKRTITAERDEYNKELMTVQEKFDDAANEQSDLEQKIAELLNGQGEVDKKQEDVIKNAQNESEQLRVELDKAQKRYEAVQSELEEAKSTLSDRGAEQQIEQLRAELDKAEDKYQVSQSELNNAKRRLQDNEAELKKALSQREQDDDETSSLRSEVNTLTEALREADLAYDQIREQAEGLSKEKEQLINKMRELENETLESKPKNIIDDNRTSIEKEVFGDVYEDVVSKGLEMAEEEALRQELEDLRKTTDNWEQRLEDAEKKCRSLDDALEDRDKEIDKIKTKLDDEKAKLAEAEEKRRQSEETINQLRELSAKGLAANEYVDSRLADSPKTVHLDRLVSDQPSKRSMFLWVLIGVAICFALLEALMLFSGRGELITGLFTENDLIDRGNSAAETSTPQALPPAIEKALISDKQNTAQPDEVVADIGKRGEKAQSKWAILNDIKLGPPMVRVNGSSFIMGSNRNQVSSDQWPAHEVEIKTFAISQTEVTFDDYDRFAQATGRALPKDQGWGRGNRPVINVSWDDAVAYTKWLSGQTGKKYRLPTEAEWEYAIRGNSDSPYWWGYQFDEGRANCFDCGSEWDRRSTSPAASFPPNNFGLYDMAGNVREWVGDCYHPNYSGAPLDGSAWVDRKCRERVVRGGAYNKTSDSMRSTWRGHLKPNLRFSYTGFRIVREL